MGAEQRESGSSGSDEAKRGEWEGRRERLDFEDVEKIGRAHV